MNFTNCVHAYTALGARSNSPTYRKWRPWRHQPSPYTLDTYYIIHENHMSFFVVRQRRSEREGCEGRDSLGDSET